MAIAYGSAGAGGGTETNAASLDLVCPASVAANDILIAHVTYEGTTTGPTTPSGWTELFGPTNLGTGTTPTGRSWVYGKIASGSEDGSTVGFGTAGGTAGRYGRIYSFTGYSSGTIDEICVGFNAIPSETSIPLPPVRTYSTGALAVALLVQDDNNAFAAAGAQTGGTWAEPVAEFVSTTLGVQGCCVGIQTSTPTANPGQIRGGTANATADEGSSIGFSIHDAPPTGLHLVSTATATYHSSTTTPKDTSETLHWLTDDLIVVTGIAGDETSTLAVPTATGLTFAQDAFTNNGTGDFSDVWIWSEVAASAGNQLVNDVRSGGGSVWGHAASVWRKSGGVGNTATGTSTTKTVSLTRSADDSAVMWAAGDWSGSAAATTATPAEGVFIYSQGDGSALGSHVHVWEAQGAAGSTSYGVSSSSTGSFAKAAIEILAAGSGEFEGTSTLAASATVTATGNMEAAGSSTLAVTDAITASGQGQGTSSLAVTAGRTASGQATSTASLAETATITATGNMSATGSSTLAVTDSVTASGQATGSSTLAGTAAITTTGRAEGTASLGVTAGITASGALQSDTSATLNVTAAITASGNMSADGTSTLAVTAGRTASGQGQGTSSLGVTDAITATGRTQGTASLAATAAITASGALVFSGTASLTVTAGRTASGRAEGTSTLTVTANRTATGRTEGTAALAVSVGISASGTLLLTGTAALVVTATISATVGEAVPPQNVVITVATGLQRYTANTGSGRYAAATGNQRHAVTTGET